MSDGLEGLPGLRYWRTRRNKTQTELAAESGVSQITISELETTGRKARAQTVKKLADALDVDPMDLQEAPQRRVVLPPLPKATEDLARNLGLTPDHLAGVGSRARSPEAMRLDIAGLWEAVYLRLLRLEQEPEASDANALNELVERTVTLWHAICALPHEEREALDAAYDELYTRVKELHLQEVARRMKLLEAAKPVAA